LQSALAQVKSGDSLETMGKLVRNVAQNPLEEKYRRIRLTNEKISAVLVAVDGAKESMLTMGWVEEGEFLILPAGVQLSMTQVRDIEDAKDKLRKEQEKAMMQGVFKKKEDPEVKRLREQMEADRRERVSQGPITQSSKPTPKGNGGIQQFQPAPSSG